MLTIRRGGALASLATAALVAILSFSSVQGAVFAPQLVELDGNIDSGGGDDWATLYAGGGSADAYSGVQVDGRDEPPGNDDIFDSPWSKDIHDISRWHWKSEPNSSPKSDIANAMAAYYDNAGDPYLYWAADRYQTDGNVKLGVWFLKNRISKNADGSFDGSHTTGDILIESDYTRGGKRIDNIKVYEWTDRGLEEQAIGTLGGDCRDSNASTYVVCGTNNGASISDGSIPWDYTGKDKPISNDYRRGAFFEGGFKLTPFYAEPGVCFTNWVIETRSSGSSVTSILEDFVLGAFPGCSTITIDKVTDPTTATEVFDFATTGGLTPGSFSLGNGDATTYSFLAPGTYTITEAETTGWTTTIDCGGDENVEISGNTITVTIPEIGRYDIACTYTNVNTPTITVEKTSTPAGTFGFSTNEEGGLPASFDITTATSGVTVSTTFAVEPSEGDFTITEDLAAGYLLTDLTCGAGVDFSVDLETRTATIHGLAYGDHATCSFVNSGVGTTRTQGFWQTHYSILQQVWNPGGVTIGGITTDGMSDGERSFACAAGGALSTEKVAGGFWAGISMTDNEGRRGPLAKARMQLLQQLLASILNNQLFGSEPTGTISIGMAKDYFCTGTLQQVKDAASQMGAFNQAGDSGLFTPGASANVRNAKAAADTGYWDFVR